MLGVSGRVLERDERFGVVLVQELEVEWLTTETGGIIKVKGG